MALEIIGQEGACLRGTVVLGRGGGSIEGVRIESTAGPAMWLAAGKWSVNGCVLLAQRSYSTALLCAGAGEIELAACRIGGGGPTEATTWGSGVARHAVGAQGRCKATLRQCQLQHCGTSAVALQHHAVLALHTCTLSQATAAVQYRVNGKEDRATLTLHDSNIDCMRVWDGDDRPFAVEDRRNTIVFFTSSAQGALVDDFSLCTYT